MAVTGHDEVTEIVLGRRPAAVGQDFNGLSFIQGQTYAGAAEVVRWCAAPMLLRAMGRSSSGPRAPYLRSLTSILPMRRGPRFVLQGDVLFASQQGNPLRTLAPIIGLRERGRPSEIVTPRGGGPAALGRYLRAGREAGGAFKAAAKAAGVETEGSQVDGLVSVAARSLARAERAIAAVRPRCVVVATQHAIDIRAVIHAARSSGVPVVYFPHAPVATSPVYADLPVDAAGLRGRAEVEHYEALGALDGLYVTGNPAVDVRRELPAIAGDRQVVFAAPPHVEDVLEMFVRLIRSAWSGPVIVSPHPRSDLEVLQRLSPANWSLWTRGSTFDLLRSGPSCVIQYSSGVAWESLALGLGTVQLVFESEVPVYPVIQEPVVRFAGTTSQLRDAIGGAFADSENDTARSRLRDWASTWCSLSGPAAAEACSELIDEVDGGAPRADPILDGWK